MKLKIIAAIVVIGACLLQVFRCSSPVAGNGSQVPNGTVSAMVYNPGGTPAANAKVYFCWHDDDPRPDSGAGVVDSTTTDANGNYSILLDTGTYNVFAQGDSGLAFQDSVKPQGGSTMHPPACTLKTPGTIRGVVQLQPGDDPRTVFILFMGTRTFTWPDDSLGNFSSGNMPAGKYRVRILTTLPDYEVMDTSFVIRAGVDSVIPEPLVLRYTGIPTPENLIVSYDTLNERVMLSWDLPDTSLLSGYNIYRSIKGQNFSLITLTPLPETQTVYYDHTGLIVGNVYEYRVVSRTAAGEESGMKDFDADTALVVSRSMVTTTFVWNAADTASINDTVPVTVSFSNPTRRINQVEWHLDSVQTTAVRTTTYSSLSGNDTIIYICSSRAGLVPIIVRATDEAGTIWRDTFDLHMIQDEPVANAGNDTTVSNRTPILLHGVAIQKFGTIVKWEWNIANSGFITISTADTSVIFSDTVNKSYPCVLRVTDDDGNINEDTMIITIHFGFLVMRSLPGGTFQMGSPTGYSNQQPVHSVTVSAFDIDTTIVTHADYKVIMGVNAPDTLSDNAPREFITWFDAVLYCNARSKWNGFDTVYSYTSITGTFGNGCADLGGLTCDFAKNGYRLPTEAEYEYACRAGTTTDYYWGNSVDDYYYWGYDNSLGILQPVALKPPNAFGLYDMIGNGLEWCNDWYGSYSSANQIDPTGPTSGTDKVRRGDVWYDGMAFLKSAARSWNTPTSLDQGTVFRCVRRK